MSHSSISDPGISLRFAQFKTQALQSMLGATSADALFQALPHSSDLFNNILAAAKDAEPTAPAGLDVSSLFGQPRQSVATIMNRAEVSFKAQFSELSELKSVLAREQDVAQKVASINGQTSNEDIKSALRDFVGSYNAGVNRFAPDVAQGGILEGSPEAARARFATQREINNPLLGADGGLRGGMRALGISIDPATGLAILDDAQLDAVLTRDKDADTRTIVAFAASFMATTANLNAAGNPQDRQLQNLHRAVNWIEANRAAVQQEFGAGQTARPNMAFANAATAYDSISKQRLE